MSPLLLAANPPPEADGPAPRVDFLELATALGGAVSYPPEKSGLWGKLESASASDIRQARATRSRSDAALFLSLSEKAGLPLALLGTRGVRHVLIAHNLTSARKITLQQRTGWLRRIDRIVVLCAEQRNYLVEEARIPETKVFLVADKVDERFFAPIPEIPVENDLIVAVGRERRDYRTLVEAMRRLPGKRAVVVASSPWSRCPTAAESEAPPGNVIFRRGLSFVELKELYAKASVVAVPLEPGTRYAAGVNGVLEAMAMGRPLVVTRTPGIADYLDEGAVRSVHPGDPDALAEALSAPDEARGRAGRLRVESGWNLDGYIARLAEIALG